MTDLLVPASPLLTDFSLETTAARAASLAEIRDLVPAGTRVSIPHLAGDSLPALTAAAHIVRDLGFRPVPHLAARRVSSAAALAEHLESLRSITDTVFVIGGDPATPAGPYASALALLESGLLPAYGVREVGLAAHPASPARWPHLAPKVAALRDQGLSGSVTTQFVPSPGIARDWVASVRAAGLELPIRLSVPGPRGVPRILAQDPRMPYRVSLRALLDEIGLEEDLKLHFSPFGALAETVGEIRAAGR